MEHNQSNLGLDQCHDCGVRRKQVANPTTNYGFVLPTPTDLVTDLPADFDVALQGVDTRLKALQPGTTLGDLAYSSATANTSTRLAIGTTDQVLSVSGGVPAWTTLAAASSGLTWLAGGSFSAVSSVSLANDIISDTYPFYRLAINFTDSSAGGDVLLRQRQSGSDYTSNYYGGGSIIEFSGTQSDIVTNNQSAWGLNEAAARIGFVIDLIGWRTATPKFAASGVFSGSAQGGGTLGGFCLGSGTPDSVSFLSSTGTFTGSYAFYGFANS
jgi:hypothetical protein